jgi:hypothetical protein
MPAVVRKNLDSHMGHASATPNPFHKTKYVQGSTNVFVNSAGVVRIGDKTACTDPAAAGSPNVFVNGIALHRKGDRTSGHNSWVPNLAATGSSNVFCNG